MLLGQDFAEHDENVSDLASKLLPRGGFGNEFASEAVPGALPLNQNTRRFAPMDFTLNNFPALRLPHRAPKTAGHGRTASIPRFAISRIASSKATVSCPDHFRDRQPRRSCAGARSSRRMRRRILSMAW